jgi:DNA-binding transcriptional regulator YdaS (Cro superfamily)
MQNEMNDALKRALKIIKGPTKLSKLAGGDISPQAISQWKKCPAGRVLLVSQHSGVPPHELRPDIYPVPAADAHP